MTFAVVFIFILFLLVFISEWRLWIDSLTMKERRRIKKINKERNKKYNN